MKGQPPQWRHTSDRPVFAELLAGMLESAVGQLATLIECDQRPSVLEDHTLNRYIVLYPNNGTITGCMNNSSRNGNGEHLAIGKPRKPVG